MLCHHRTEVPPPPPPRPAVCTAAVQALGAPGPSPAWSPAGSSQSGRRWEPWPQARQPLFPGRGHRLLSTARRVELAKHRAALPESKQQFRWHGAARPLAGSAPRGARCCCLCPFSCLSPPASLVRGAQLGPDPHPAAGSLAEGARLFMLRAIRLLEAGCQPGAHLGAGYWFPTLSS